MSISAKKKNGVWEVLEQWHPLLVCVPEVFAIPALRQHPYTPNATIPVPIYGTR